jgi:hypothetical protein
MLASMNINLPVGTADADSYFNNDLLGAVDFGVRVSFFNVWERRDAFFFGPACPTCTRGLRGQPSWPPQQDVSLL